MLLAIEILAALYVVSFLWLWWVARKSVHRKDSEQPPGPDSNLIPFERSESQGEKSRTHPGAA